MSRKHRDTITYAALSAGIALAAIAVWILTTGRLDIPPGVIPVFSIGAALIATGVERTVPFLRGRRWPRGSARHRKPAASRPLAERANALPAPTEGEA